MFTNEKAMVIWKMLSELLQTGLTQDGRGRARLYMASPWIPPARSRRRRAADDTLL